MIRHPDQDEERKAYARLFETMQTMRAMRRLKPEPVPDELIRKILQQGCARQRRNTSAGGSW